MSRPTQEERRAHADRARRLFLACVSLYVAYELAATGVIATWVYGAIEHALPGSFIAGMFFTSLLSLAPASVVLSEIANATSPLFVATFGAAGAVVGDLFLLTLVRDTVSTPLLKLFRSRQFAAIRHRPFMHWFLPLCGALIIASPFPDELGLALLGISRMRLSVFIPIAYMMNFIGILAIGYIGASLV